MKLNFLSIILLLSVVLFNLAPLPLIAQIQGQGQGEQNIAYEQQVTNRDSRIDEFSKFLTESFIGIVMIIIFVVFLAGALYLALGVIFLVFFGGIGGK